MNNQGFNSKTGKVEDLVEAGVVDPAKVVLSAVKAAIGVASGILTLGTVVLLPKEEPPQGQPSLIQR
jgi:chaperonin GroEL